MAQSTSGLPYTGTSRRVLGVIETGSLRVDEVEYAAGLCLPRHSHERASFSCTLEGAHWSGHSRGADLCPPGTVRFLPVGEPHENYFPSASRCLQVEVKPSLLGLAAEERMSMGRPGEIRTASASLFAARLEREFRKKDDLSPLAIELHVLELLLDSAHRNTPARGGTPPWLLCVRDLLNEHEATRLSLADLSRCAGRHPVQVSRQFHRHFRCTISEYVRRVRIGRAQRLLVASDLALADIALVSGFSDQSHFTTVFRRLTGVSPGRYRAEAARAGP
jgi:AraC family transcriptional regulator